MFAGDNFFRHSRKAPDVRKLQLFAWQAAACSNGVHLDANPTRGNSSKVSILAKYGGEKYLKRELNELLREQMEEHVESTRIGQVVKGKKQAKAKSMYAEDGTCSRVRS